jgi:hypothetical protein
VIRKSTIQLYVLGSVITALAMAGGCELVASVDRTKIGATGGATPAGGMGGIGGATGGGGMAGGGMGGGGMMCVPGDCPGTDTDCHTPDCVNDMCAIVSEMAELPCDDGVAPAKYCDDAGECTYECVGDPDCTVDPNTACDVMNHICVPEQCQNMTFDGDETDVDCGGPTCGPCATNDADCSGGTCACAADSDCVSLFCDGSNVCSDCASPADCAAGEYCDFTQPVNQKNCLPDVANGLPCNLTYGDPQCVNGHCVDEAASGGVCCDTACNAPDCQACVMSKTGSADGTCAAVTAGQDIDGDCTFVANTQNCEGDTCAGGSPACAAAMSGVCRNAVNVCDVAESCMGALTCPSNGFANPGTACPNGVHCDGAETCNGSGTCVDNADPCPGPDGDADCSETCREVQMDCNGNDTPGSACPNGQCQGGSCLLNNGQACTLPSQCLNNFCVDNFCCNNACSSLCLACSNAKTGAANGTCAPVTVDTDPDMECAAPTCCDGLVVPSCAGTACP